MKLRTLSTSLILAASSAAAILACASPAAADPTPSRRNSDTYTEMTPNADLIASGLFTFAVPYVTSVAVGSQSTRVGDHYLYTPVAGPWLDLTYRDNCPPVGTCANETAYRIMLVADGVLQGFGALEVLSGFLFPVPHTVNSETRVHVAPTVANNSAGVTAFGKW